MPFMRQDVKLKFLSTPCGQACIRLSGSGGSPIRCFLCLFRRSLILPKGLLFKPLAGLESKIKRSKKQTSISLLQFVFLQTEEGVGNA
jgi:hypothetical protein